MSFKAQVSTPPETVASADWNPTHRILEDGALQKLPEIVSDLRAEKVLFVLGQSSFRESAHFEELKKKLLNCQIWESLPTPANPTISFVEQLRSEYGNQPPDLVVAIGGGSVIDCAKALRLLLAQAEEVSLETYLEGEAQFAHPGLPFVAVPTTAGTGSEVTQYASLKTEEGKKVSLTHPWLYPDLALIDPLLTHSMTSYVTACTGFDALSQGIESFWSVHHSKFSETHSLRAIALVVQHLERAFKDPLDAQARCAMSLAASESGLAISKTRTTAVHAASYPLTTFYGIAHGHACALTLPAFIRYNAPALDPEQANQLWQALGVTSADEAAQFLEGLMERLGLERSLRGLGLAEEAIEAVVENGFRSDRAGNNPRPVTREALHEILRSIY